MTTEEVMMLLYNYCSWKDCDSIKELCKEYPNEIDLTDDDGMLFKMAVAYKSAELVNTLLDCYKKTKLQGNEDSIEYKLANLQLKHMLQYAEEAHDLTPEIQKIIGPYLIEEEESDNEQDLSGFDIEDYDAQDGRHYTMHKSNSAPELLSHKTLTTSLLHSSSESIISSRDSSDGKMDEGGHPRDVLGQDFENPATE